jgi:hypothetical protein
MELSRATVLFLVLTGVPLAAIQIRRMLKGELSLCGVKSFTDASKIKIDRFDKIMLVLSAASFCLFVILLFANK